MFPSAARRRTVGKSFQDWVSEGESLYANAMAEYQALEAQIHKLETQLADKRSEVNHIAEMLGKPAVEGGKRVVAQVIEREVAMPMGAITRALTGRGNVAR
jgi:beta-glucanase (GH16 family)